jgi:hypothetical protein
MSTIVEAEKLALSLPVSERAKLADRLFRSLPDDFIDEEELEEARWRSREMDRDPSRIITPEQLDELLADKIRR